ncbi:hypothetical protein L596_021700 [Steinernema carpocapsae]|uniref:Uncharacterized protein n=1 Tax=Steinernema carpocapsae TaxID=34508 RepID=A0A4U5MJI6_STECR|nr:hypothetical protein L596_021700 [Steinernema carpocapsae]
MTGRGERGRSGFPRTYYTHNPRRASIALQTIAARSHALKARNTEIGVQTMRRTDEANTDSGGSRGGDGGLMPMEPCWSLMRT